MRRILRSAWGDAVMVRGFVADRWRERNPGSAYRLRRGRA